VYLVLTRFSDIQFQLHAIELFFQTCLHTWHVKIGYYKKVEGVLQEGRADLLWTSRGDFLLPALRRLTSLMSFYKKTYCECNVFASTSFFLVGLHREKIGSTE
jgi:hypothetical protein